MGHLTIESLNEQFAVPDHARFEAGPGGLPIVVITNKHATATVSLHGGHVLSYQPTGHEDVLWVSRQSKFESGKAIRGGIPICWPWFADHPTDPSKPAHGIVRTAMWKILATNVIEDDQTQVRMGISDTPKTREVWPHPFDLTVTVTVGPQLQVDLAGVNKGDKNIVCGGALHAYFNVSSASEIAILGLDGCTYINKVDAFKQKTQQGPVKITALTDSVYLNTADDCIIEDPGKTRRIRVAKSGSRSTVVWNPWSEKATGMADFGDDEFRSMVCVEAANAADDVATVAPGQAHRMGTQIGVEALTPAS